MKKIIVRVISKNKVCSQIVTGFYCLDKSEYDVIIEDHMNDVTYEKYRVPIVEVVYDGKINDRIGKHKRYIT